MPELSVEAAFLAGALALPLLLVAAVHAWTRPPSGRRARAAARLHERRFARLLARHGRSLPPGEVLRRGRRAILRASALTVFVLTAAAALLVAISHRLGVGAAAARWGGAFVAALLLASAAACAARLRELARWAQGGTIAFLSPAAGLVLIRATRLLCHGEFRDFLPGGLIEAPGGRPGIGRLERDHLRPYEVFLFDFPEDLPAAARDAVAAYLAHPGSRGRSGSPRDRLVSELGLD